MEDVISVLLEGQKRLRCSERDCRNLVAIFEGHLVNVGPREILLLPGQQRIWDNPEILEVYTSMYNAKMESRGGAKKESMLERAVLATGTCIIQNDESIERACIVPPPPSVTLAP